MWDSKILKLIVEIAMSLSQKHFQPPRHDPSGMTHLLWKGGESSDIQYYNILLLDKEEYPDRSVRGRWWTFEKTSALRRSELNRVIYC